MEKMFNNSVYKEVGYKLNPEGYYQKEPQRLPFTKLPFEIKVEPSQKEFLKQQGANEIITGRFKNKKREFFTGLIPIAVGFFMGNDWEFIQGQKKTSLIVFQFSDNNEFLSVYYFNRYYIDQREARIKFVLAFIQHLSIENF